MNSKLSGCGLCSNSCHGCVLPKNNDPTIVRSEFRLLMFWNENAYSKVKEKMILSKVSHESSEKRENQLKLTLYDCINSFTKPERLGKDDAWYCSKCKDFRQATKKFDIWKAPEILIIHLKRFQIVGNRREKISIPVDFPLQGLSLKDIALDPSDSQPIYDLFAISVCFSLTISNLIFYRIILED
jgi:hypothetical protein